MTLTTALRAITPRATLAASRISVASGPVNSLAQVSERTALGAGAWKQRVGIFAGSFDPVHQGHVAFAVEAAREAELERVYFLPETRPPRKGDITDVAHRLAMLHLAITPYPQLAVLEQPNEQLSVATTLPRLEQHFAGSQIFVLLGLDVLEDLPSWPSAEQLVTRCGLVVAPRRESRQRVEELVATLARPPRALYVIETPHRAVSSTDIRSAMATGTPRVGSLPSVDAYIKEHHLYSVAASP
jgi:nicotinate-nucleotide adenylyltransferase